MIRRSMGSPTIKGILSNYILLLSKRGINKKLYHPWSGLYKVIIIQIISQYQMPVIELNSYREERTGILFTLID